MIDLKKFYYIIKTDYKNNTRYIGAVKGYEKEYNKYWEEIIDEVVAFSPGFLKHIIFDTYIWKDDYDHVVYTSVTPRGAI